MHSTLEKWLSELNRELTLTYSKKVNVEACENMVCFDVNVDLLDEWSKEFIIEFIEACYKVYSKKNTKNPMWFYSWFDEQASQIRISAISKRHNGLPFKVKLNSTELEVVTNGFFEGDSGIFSKGSLNIWQSSI